MFIQLHDFRSYFNRIGLAFRALQAPNYRVFMTGQLASVIGTWIQIIAMGWLVYRLTGSALMLGTIGFASQIPSLFITPFAGVYADRINRKNVIIGTQVSSMLLSFMLALLVLTNNIEVWHIVAIAILYGITNAIDTPFRHAFVRDMVDKPELLQNAIALNSTLFNSARFIGPTIGGFLIALVGEGWCFFINGASYLAVLWSLFSIRIAFKPAQNTRPSVWRELLSGLSYSYRTLPVRYMLLLVVASGFFCLPFQTFLPVYARDILQGDSSLYGILTGAYGAGALSGALFLAIRQSIKGIPKLIATAALIFPIGLAAFSLSPSIGFSIALLVFAGFGMIAQYTSVNILLQIITDKDKVGRVISLYGMSFMGITPIGTILLGALAGVFDVRWVLFASSLLSLIFVVVFWVKRRLVQEAVDKVDHQ